MNEAIMNLIMTILVAVATGAVSVAVAFLQSKIKSEKTNDALARLGEATAVTVGELQQTTVEAWKAAGGGKLNKAEIEALKDMVKDKTVQKLDKPAIALLDSVGADIGALIAGFAEDAVRQIKNEDVAFALPVEVERR